MMLGRSSVETGFPPFTGFPKRFLHEMPEHKEKARSPEPREDREEELLKECVLHLGSYKANALPNCQSSIAKSSHQKPHCRVFIT